MNGGEKNRSEETAQGLLKMESPDHTTLSKFFSQHVKCSHFQSTDLEIKGKTELLKRGATNCPSGVAGPLRGPASAVLPFLPPCTAQMARKGQHRPDADRRAPHRRHRTNKSPSASGSRARGTVRTDATEHRLTENLLQHDLSAATVSILSAELIRIAMAVPH